MEWWDNAGKMSVLRSKFEWKLTEMENVFVNGNIRSRLPNTSNLSIGGIKADLRARGQRNLYAVLRWHGLPLAARLRYGCGLPHHALADRHRARSIMGCHGVIASRLTIKRRRPGWDRLRLRLAKDQTGPQWAPLSRTRAR